MENSYFTAKSYQKSRSYQRRPLLSGPFTKKHPIHYKTPTKNLLFDIKLINFTVEKKQREESFSTNILPDNTKKVCE